MLGFNKLTEIRADMWQGLSNLKHLGLWSNPISTIPDGCFGTLTELGNVNLGGIKLSEVRPEML